MAPPTTNNILQRVMTEPSFVDIVFLKAAHSFSFTFVASTFKMNYNNKLVEVYLHYFAYSDSSPPLLFIEWCYALVVSV